MLAPLDPLNRKGRESSLLSNRQRLDIFKEIDLTKILQDLSVTIRQDLGERVFSAREKKKIKLRVVGKRGEILA